MAKPTNRALDQILSELVAPQLKGLGFESRPGGFVRELSSSVRHIIVFDLRPDRGRLNLMLAVSCRALGNETIGGPVRTMVGPRGIDPVNAPLPAGSLEELRATVEGAFESLKKQGMDWFERIRTLEELLDVMPEKDRLGKGVLLLALGRKDDARTAFEAHINFLEGLGAKTKSITSELNETRSKLEQCEAD